MAVDPGLADRVTELFGGLGDLRCKRMFGALGVYADDLFFAVADDGDVYVKADDATEGEFRAAGSEPFSFTDKEGAAQTMRYWRLPADAYDEPDAALRWGRLGLEAALRARSAKPARKRKA